MIHIILLLIFTISNLFNYASDNDDNNRRHYHFSYETISLTASSSLTEGTSPIVDSDINDSDYNNSPPEKTPVLQFENTLIENSERLQVNLTGTTLCTAPYFTQIIQACPKIHTIKFTNHSTEQLDDLGHKAEHLQILILDNGPLKAMNTVPLILITCPTLQILSLQNNKIRTLQETQIPSNHPLQYLFCNKNEISNINFTVLTDRLRNLIRLNASNCPLQTFNVNAASTARSNYIPHLKLHDTQLSDAMKVSILKNSLSVNKNIHFISWFVGGLCGALVGGFLSAIPVAALGLSAGIIVPGGMALGPAITYTLVIGSTSPRHRETVSYTVDFGQETNTAEIEVSTRFQYIVRHFPYFCSPCSSQEDDNPSDEHNV